MGKLIHFRADGAPTEIKLDRQRITIGRRPDNDVCLAYPAVSGEHASVVTILSDSFLEDLGSTNGTLVNGTAVAKHFLRDRDEIDIGQQILVYLVDDAATLEAPPHAARSSAVAAPRVGADETTSTTSAAAPGIPGAQRAKRRSDAVAPSAAVATDADGSTIWSELDGNMAEVPATAPEARAAAAEVVATAPEVAVRVPEVPGSAPDVAAAAPDAPASAPEVRGATPAAAPERRAEPVPALKVVSGAKAGRIVALVKDETLIGRTGVQVVALRRSADEVRVVLVEGARPPSVNGAPVAPEGTPLAAGDILEIAGTRLEVIDPAKAPSA